MDPSTLSSHKSSFLLSQIRLLSTPLHPTPTLTTQLSPSNPDALSPKLLTDLLTRVNTKVAQHNKSVFPAQTQRHVVEQIESLYFAEALAEQDLDDEDENMHREEGEEFIAIERDVDLTSSAVLAGLPEELAQCMLHDISDLSLSSSQADEYYTLRQQLQQLSQQRDAAREKVQRYNRLQEVLKPFENAQESVQPNLVGKEGEMAREMERMRGLVARVKGRMGERGGMWEGDGEERGKGRSRGFDEKLRRVMEMERS